MASLKKRVRARARMMARIRVMVRVRVISPLTSLPTSLTIFHRSRSWRRVTSVMSSLFSRKRVALPTAVRIAIALI
jgi:uncharacterized lipoprotein YbaY